MLCLKRYTDTEVEIRDTRTGEHIATVRVVEVGTRTGKGGAHVILGFEGPRHIQFLRDDAHQREPIHVGARVLNLNQSEDGDGNTKTD
jgi:hypothetical protein